MPVTTPTLSHVASPARPAGVPVATFFVEALKRTVAYADLLTRDVPADRFAFMPHPTMNHPAFNIGHLSLYPNRAFLILSRPELVVEKPGFAELFQAGTPCRNDAKLYPHKDEIVSFYRERHEAILKFLPTVPDEAFQRPNPLEGRLREIFPLVGSAVNFLLNNHNMSHLGQVSAWRRAVGLPSVM